MDNSKEWLPGLFVRDPPKDPLTLGIQSDEQTVRITNAKKVTRGSEKSVALFRSGEVAGSFFFERPSPIFDPCLKVPFGRIEGIDGVTNGEHEQSAEKAEDDSKLVGGAGRLCELIIVGLPEFLRTKGEGNRQDLPGERLDGRFALDDRVGVPSQAGQRFGFRARSMLAAPVVQFSR